MTTTECPFFFCLSRSLSLLVRINISTSSFNFILKTFYCSLKEWRTNGRKTNEGERKSSSSFVKNVPAINYGVNVIKYRNGQKERESKNEKTERNQIKPNEREKKESSFRPCVCAKIHSLTYTCTQARTYTLIRIHTHVLVRALDVRKEREEKHNRALQLATHKKKF